MNNFGSATQNSPTRVIPLPYAWYVYGPLIYELFQGGQPGKRFSPRWEPLRPIERRTSPPGSTDPSQNSAIPKGLEP